MEREERLKAATGTYNEASELTLLEACNRYYEEHGKHQRSALAIKRRLEVMMDCVGPRLKLADIDAPQVVAAQAKRRLMDLGYGLPSASTVNRDIIDTSLRPLLNRARKVWKAKGLPDIPWSELRSSEPKGAVREYSDSQVDAWKAELEPVPRFALHLLLTYGLRFGELFMKPDDVDGEGRLLRLAGRYRKNGEELWIPLTTNDARILSAMAGRAKAAKLRTVLHAGEPAEAFEYHQLHRLLTNAAHRAGLDMERLIHGARHHAATRMLRKTDNLRKTQKLLGHATIVSTARYAHVQTDDLRDDLEAMSRYSPEAELEEPPTALTKKGKSEGA
ncbi:tyrosine-type recombinase/integrase [Thalassovita mediterranea]|nr:tyrosine-type recombinase/integrase [Thalassovita mediterranea]